MDSVSQQRPPAPGSASQNQALPSIASLTSSLSPAEQSPVRLRQQSEAREARDSGNWSISQSKRKFHSFSPAPLLTDSSYWQSCNPPANSFNQTRRAFRTRWACNYRLSSMPRTRRHGTPCRRRPHRPDIHLSKYVHSKAPLCIS